MLDMFKKKNKEPAMQNISAVLYLVSAVLFILSLKGLSSPASSRKGNTYGMIGMLIAVATTFMVMEKPVLLLIVGAIAAGAAIGAFKAKTVEMTSMPSWWPPCTRWWACRRC